MVRKGVITGHTPTICSSANNTPLDISMGKLNISLQYTPVFPADYIRVSMVQQLVSNFSVQLGS
jgi:phage tail sheath protein FI